MDPSIQSVIADSVAIEAISLHWIGHFFVAAAGLGCLYLLTAAFVLLRHRAPADASPPIHVPVTLLKPLYGGEAGLFGRLSSFCRQNYSAPIQIIFGVQDPADPAIEVVRRIETSMPDSTIELKIDAREHGSNRKMSNLINMASIADMQRVAILADSDIEVGPDYLGAVVKELQRPGVGAVTCLYHGTADQGVWSELSRLALNTHFLPSVVTALSFGAARPCFGSTIALRPDVLKRIGGLQAFKDCLADDYAIGEAVHAAGYQVAVPAFSVGHACNQTSLRQTWESDLRAARTIRNIDPVGYVGSIVTHPLPLALIGALLGSADAMAMALLAIACRVALCICVERTFNLDRHAYWLLPLRDLMSFAVYIAGYFGRGVRWRGYRYRVMTDGTLIQDTNTLQP
jgi:ceramide glucosyltransferase